MGFEIIAVGEIRRIDRRGKAVDECMAMAVEDPYRFDLRRFLRESLQPIMQRQLVRRDLRIGHTANDFIDFRDRALDRFKHLQRVFVNGIGRPFDLAIGDVLRTVIAKPRGVEEKCQGQRDGRHQGALQQSDGVALGSYHISN
jgi:hypothetical protein